MKVIETLYDYAKKLDQQVMWIKPATSFKEMVQQNDIASEIFVEQDGFHITLKTSLLSLVDIETDKLIELQSMLLDANFKTHQAVVFSTSNNTVYLRAIINIGNDLNEFLTLYTLVRNEMLLTVNSTLPKILQVST